MKPSSLATSFRVVLLLASLARVSTHAAVRVELIGGDSPMPGQVAPGSTVTLKVAAIGQGPDAYWDVGWAETDMTKATFQWYRGTTPIPGATATSLVLPNVSPADAGNYSVRVASTVPAEDWGTFAVNVAPAPGGQFVDTSFTASNTTTGTNPNLDGIKIANVAATLADGSVVVAGQSLGDFVGWKAFGPDGEYLTGWALDTIHYSTSVHIWPDGTVVTTVSYGYPNPTDTVSTFDIRRGHAQPIPAEFAYEKLSAMLVDGDATLIAQDRRLVRLDAARKLDPTFTAHLPSDATSIDIIKRDAAGKYLVVVRDAAKQATLVRLERDGSTDTAFTPFAFPSEANPLWPVPQADGSVLFTMRAAGATSTSVLRLRPDGTRDPDFHGRVPIGFIEIDAHGRCYGMENRQLWRYFAGGDLEIDPTYHPGGAGDGYIGFTLDAQDRVVAAGQFTSWNGHATVNVARLLNTEGQKPSLPAVWLKRDSIGATSAAYARFGSKVWFTGIVLGDGPFTYDWVALDGGKLPADTHSRTLVFDRFATENLGRYQLHVSSPAGVGLSEVVDLSASSLPPVTLANLSGRATVGAGEDAPIAGFVTNSSHDSLRPYLLRGAGEALQQFQLGDTATDPVLSLHDAQGATIAENDDWQKAGMDLTTEFTTLGAFPFHQSSTDAALLYQCPGGLHTVRLSDKQAHDGVGMIEIYDGWANAEYYPGQLVNLSLRAKVGTGANIAIAGFVLNDTTGFDRSVRILIRGVGPALASFGVQHPLSNPQLSLFNAKGELLKSNDSWSDNSDAAALSAAAKQVGAFSLPSGSKDAALLVDLPAGVYTVHLAGADHGTGVALLEIYLVP